MSIVRAVGVGAGIVLFGVAACGGPLQVMGRDDQPTPEAMRVPLPVHAHNDSSIELPGDEQVVEP